MRFAALNRESSSVPTPSSKRTRPTKEAQESACLQLYHTAIKYQQEGEMEQAKTLYREILESELLEEAESILADGGTVMTSMILKVKYLTFKNLAGMAKEQGDLSAAIDAYIQCSSVDTTDITMWCQLASAASSLGNLLLARKALEQALLCNDRYWPAIESLCTVLFALQDFGACLHVVSKGLDLEPNYPRGIAYLHHIFQECPDITSQFAQLRIHLMKPCLPEYAKYKREADGLKKKRDSLCKVEFLDEPITPPKKLGCFSILSLGKCLISLYQHCKELSNTKPSFAVKIDLSTVTEGTWEGIMICSQSPIKKPDSASASPKKDGIAELESHQGSGDEGTGGKKETKRKAVEEVATCAPKRRSTRVKSKKKEQQSYFEILKKYIPPWLQVSDVPCISELSPLRKPKEPLPNSVRSERQKLVAAVVDAMPRLPDVDTVQKFIEQHQDNCGIIDLLYEYVLYLASHYQWKWAIASFPTVKVFMDAYNLLHPHLSFPSTFGSTGDDAETEYLRQLAMIALCYVETYVDSVVKSVPQFSKRPEPSTPKLSSLPKCFQECFTFVHQCTGSMEDERTNRIFSLRASWCLAKWRGFQSKNEAAILALKTCKDILQVPSTSSSMETSEPDLVVYLCNCTTDQIISLDHIEEKIKLLEQSFSFEQIQQLFNEEKYSNVADQLLPVLDQESGTYIEFLIGSEGALREETGLSLLLQSLLKLNRTQAFLQCCIQVQLELLLHYKMGNNQWVAALKNTYSLIDRCLSEKIEEVLECCDVRMLKRLVICVLKTMDVVYDMSDSVLFYSMPICSPWKIFYLIISSKWPAEVQASSPEPMEVEQPLPPMAETPMAEKPKAETPMAETPMAETPKTETPKAETPKAETPIGPENRPQEDVIPTTVKDILPVKESQQLSSSALEVLPEAVPTSKSRSGSPEDPGELSPSLRFLKEAHDHLGSLGWCCKDEGCFLQSSVAALRKELRVLTAHPPKHRQTLLLELEQCYYCLHGHPYKKAKSRGLQDHGAEQVPLTWEAALMLIEYCRPSFLPFIDDTKSTQVTTELIALYKQIIEVIPDIGQVVSMDALNSFVDGNQESLQEPKPSHEHSALISEIYYILADDCLKSGDNHKALRYYLLNLSYSPARFDSWAGLALARSRKIIEKINVRDFRTGTEKYVQKQTGPTVRCFQKAVSLDCKHCFIAEKFGFFCYAVQSFASQILSQPNLFTSQDIQSWASSTRREMLHLAEKSFLQALGLEGTMHAEPWIYNLILGKIGYKLGRPLNTCLLHFLKSAEKLHKDGARYPEYVEINAKGHAMEAIEVHYQLHSCTLKCLLKEGSLAEDQSLWDTLKQVQCLPLGSVTHPTLWEWARKVAEDISPGRQEESCLKDAVPIQEKVTAQRPSTPVVSLPSSSQASTISSPSLFSSPGHVSKSLCLLELPEPQQEQVTAPSYDQPKELLDIITEKMVEGEMEIGEPLTHMDQPPCVAPVAGEGVCPVKDHEKETNMVQQSIDQVAVIPERDKDDTMETSRQGSELAQSTAKPICKLLHLCIYNITLCAVRCPAYFKPLYRLASVLTEVGLTEFGRQLLLGPLPQPVEELQEKLQPLFVLKTNIFSNMWQIPADEINRPGTFSTHARKNLELLVKVLAQMKDTHSLILLAQQLKAKPDSAKKYMRDVERVAMLKEIVKKCVSVLRELVTQSLSVLSSDLVTKLLLDAYIARGLAARTDDPKQTLLKATDTLLLHIYKAFAACNTQEEPIECKASDPQLEAAIKFCQSKQKASVSQ